MYALAAIDATGRAGPGRGLVVLTGCGHAGIINICRYAQRPTGVGKLHAVIGGSTWPARCSNR